MKCCLFGGTFDPPHTGHLIIVEHVRQARDIEKVLFVPAYRPPHKTAKAVTSVERRLEMLALALAGNPHFQRSDLEVRRRGVSYTVDTLRQLRDKYGYHKNDLGIIIGADSLSDFHTWKEPGAITDLARLLVAPRPGVSLDPDRDYQTIKFELLDTPLIDLSSRMIRQRVARGLSIRYLVPEKVAEYIKRHGLYQNG